MLNPILPDYRRVKWSSADLFVPVKSEDDIEDAKPQPVDIIMRLPSVSQKFASALLRITMGIIFVTHGAARLIYSSVTDFGTFLDSQGFVIGIFLAWAVTIGELIFGSMLVIGYKVKYCVIFHSVVVLAGIFLIHLSNGWFVVGHGANGVEYSILILAVLLFLYSED